MYIDCVNCFYLSDNRLGGITVTAARYSSEDVVILVEYVLALLHYTEQFKPYKKIVDYLTNLYAEQESRENSPPMFDKTSSDEFIEEDQVWKLYFLFCLFSYYIFSTVCSFSSLFIALF